MNCQNPLETPLTAPRFAQRTYRVKSFARPYVLLFVITTLLWIIGGVGFVRHSNRTLRNDAREKLLAVATLKTEQIQAWRAERLSDLRVHSEGLVRAGVLRWLADPEDVEWSDALRMHFLTLGEAYGLGDVMLASPEGMLLQNLDPLGVMEPEAKALILLTAATGTAHIGDLYRCALHDNHVHLDTAAPIIDDTGTVAAVLLLRADPESDLFPHLAQWPTPSPSAETLLIRVEDDALVFLNLLRHTPTPPLSKRIPLEREDLAPSRAARGETGIRFRTDYRGVEVLSDIRPIEDSPWFLITKVDRAEVMAQAYQRTLAVAVVVVLGAIISGAFAGLLSLRRRHDLMRQLFTAERERSAAFEESRTILYAIGDGVITTDAAGCVTRMNPVAETLTGWPETEARGQPIDTVFHISTEETGAKVENPVAVVLRKGIIVGLANHTVLTARDGTVRPIADSGAPVRDAQGNMVGVVLVFRDQTAERRAQQDLQAGFDELARFNRLMVDREIRMIELKGEINELCRALNQPVRYRDAPDGSTAAAGTSESPV